MKNIEQKEDFKKYFNYIKLELTKTNTRSSNSILDRISEINESDLDVDTIRFIVRSIEFVNRMDKTKLPMYSEWYKYLKDSV